MEKLKKVLHDELNEQAEAFKNKPTTGTLQNLYYLLKVVKMINDVEPLHITSESIETMTMTEKPKSLWG